MVLHGSTHSRVLRIYRAGAMEAEANTIVSSAALPLMVPTLSDRNTSILHEVSQNVHASTFSNVCLGNFDNYYSLGK